MSYKIHITAAAERDLLKAADYIEFFIKNPDAADHLLDTADKQISSLAEMPQRYRIVDDPVLSTWEIRFIKVNNYLAFYTIDENKQLVIIVRFLYQKSNWAFILHHGIPLQ